MNDNVFPASASPASVKQTWKPGSTRPEGPTSPLSFEQTLSAQEEKNRPDSSSAPGSRSTTGAQSAGASTRGKSAVHPGHASARGKEKNAPQADQAAAPAALVSPTQPFLAAIPVLPAAFAAVPSLVADGAAVDDGSASVAAQSAIPGGSPSQAAGPAAAGGPAMPDLLEQALAAQAPQPGTGGTAVPAAEAFGSAKVTQPAASQISQPLTPDSGPESTEKAFVSSDVPLTPQSVTPGATSAPIIETFSSSKAAQPVASQASQSAAPAGMPETGVTAAGSTKVVSSQSAAPAAAPAPTGETFGQVKVTSSQPAIPDGAAVPLAASGSNKSAQSSQPASAFQATAPVAPVVAASNANSPAPSPISAQAAAQPARKPAAVAAQDSDSGITGQPAIKTPAANQSAPVATPSPVAAQPAVSQVPLPAGAAALALVQQVENQIAAAVQQGRRSLRMQLNPRELGAIDVHLVTIGQTLSVTLTADKAATGSLLEKQLEDLRANLANAGVHQVTVNVGHQATSGQQGNNFNSETNPQHYSGGGKNKDTSQSEAMPDPQLPLPGQDARIDYRI